MAEIYYISSNKYSLRDRETKRGKVYDVRFRVLTVDGNEIMKCLSGYKTKSLAKQAYLEFVKEHCELVKRNPLKKKDPTKEIPTIGDLTRQYMATLGNQNKESSIYDKNNIFRLYVLPYFETTKANAITKEMLYEWQDRIWSMRNERTGEYFSYKYLSKVRGTFNTLLAWIERRYGYENALPAVEKPKKRSPKKEMSFWTREEFGRFIAVVDNSTYHALFTFAFFMGARKGELFALSPADVKPTSVLINKSVARRTFGAETYKVTETKAYKSQNIPVCQIVQDEIKRYKPEKGAKFYFGGDNPLPATTVSRKFDKWIEIAGVKRIRIHDLRHSFVSMLIHHGANVMVVADLINDTVEQVIKTYGHLYQEDKMAVLSKIF